MIAKLSAPLRLLSMPGYTHFQNSSHTYTPTPTHLHTYHPSSGVNARVYDAEKEMEKRVDTKVSMTINLYVCVRARHA